MTTDYPITEKLKAEPTEILARALHDCLRDHHGGVPWDHLGRYAQGDYRARAGGILEEIAGSPRAIERLTDYPLGHGLEAARTTLAAVLGVKP